jgi:tetratricopeptide (TPR) repeat protein
MIKVFISYTHEAADATLAQELCNDLSAPDREIFFDRHIRPGSDFEEKIGEQLSGCDAFLLLASRAAHESEWVRAELRVAHELSRANGGRPRILVLLLDAFASMRRMGWRMMLGELQHISCVDRARDYPSALTSIRQELEALGRRAESPPGPVGPAEIETASRQGMLSGPVVHSIQGLLATAQGRIAQRDVATARELLRACEKLAVQEIGVAPAELRIQIANTLALVLALQRDLDGALDCALRARGLLTEYNSPADSATNNQRLGYIHLQRGEIYDALKHLELADVLARDHHLDELRGQVQDVLGGCWSALGFLDVAIEHYQSSLALKAQTGDRIGQAITHGNLGRTYQRSGRLVEAREHFEKDREISLEVGDYDGVLMMQSHLAGLYRQELRYEESLRAYREYLARAEYEHRKQHIAFGHLGLAQVHIELGQFHEAEKHLEAAQQFTANWFRPWLMRATADLALMRRESAEALFFYRKALDAAESGSEQPSELVEILGRIAQVQAAEGKRAEAAEHLERALEIARQKRLRWLIGRIRVQQARLNGSGGQIFQRLDMPFPIALLASRLDSATESLARLDCLIELFKGVLKYTTVLALAQYLSLRSTAGAGRQEVDEAIVRIFERRNPSNGLWAEGLATILPTLGHHYESLYVRRLVDVMMCKVRDHFNLAPEPQQIISRFLAVRNQISHARRPDPAEALQLVGELEKAMARLTDALQPLWAYRMIAAQETGGGNGGGARWRDLTGPSSFVHWPTVAVPLPPSVLDGAVALWEIGSPSCLSLTPWWMAIWRADRDTRGDLFLFSKRTTQTRITFLNLETREVRDLPVAWPDFNPSSGSAVGQ